MKKQVLFFVFLISLTLVVIQGCEDDDTAIDVNSTPEFTSLMDKVSSLPGEDFVFEATVTDPAGIRTVNMKYAPWFLDKTIVKEDLPVTYNLKYNFKVPDDAEPGSTHTIPLTVTNAGDKSFVQEVVITLDKDVTPPEIAIQQPIDGVTALLGDGNEIVFDITVTDNEALAEFKIESDLLTETIPISGISYTYTNQLDVAVAGNYNFIFTATDAEGNTQVNERSVNVVEELIFNEMFITDATNNSMLVSDLFGIPYTTTASEAAGEDGYVFTAKYYAAAANAEVRFIPQGSSFSPFAFGADPDAPGTLKLGSDETVSPIIIPEVGYYEIAIDLRNLSYTVTQYTPGDDAFDQVYIIGRGVITDGTNTCTNNADGSTQCWNFRSGKPFVSDPVNSYLWTLDVTLEDQPNDEGENGFILNANPSGWSPFWRFDDRDSPTATVPGGGVEFVYAPSAFGEYTITFDTHLNRFVVQRR